ncbi:enoyl-CoA hydratase/isomerase family protein [Myroides pelagicus]|uniref:Enoyl-CoA hydratase n=1 Tax=Myroides pelagicus TaxID=270914 RepID=A0A7K1GSV4_9FLAO|nr:enoyl-CoA hydratase-related protein [Myroides pelagicus]MEC4112695.1 enoyl-CoA hydratase-related protein [Myroides pelagicus]MTH30904.1 enoyl-CoA hydratase [Myroides pelagicus]
MNYENILIEKEKNLAIITINRPKSLNALNKATIEELNHLLITLESDKETKAIILTGSGEKAFVAGADIKEFSNFNTSEGSQLAAKGQELLFDYVQNYSKPIIAAVNGFALGGGLELAMAAHFRTASSNARMGLPEVTLGLIPGYGGTQRLPQLIGKGRAMEMIMTAEMINADKALDFGLVNHVVEQSELLTFTKQIAQKITNNSSTAIGKAIKSINANYRDGINGFHEEIKCFGECFDTEDFKEGTTAFIEKRKAEFKGTI